MPRFFIENIKSDSLIIEGADAIHISRSLRMKIGDIITICDTKSVDYTCEIENIDKTSVRLSVLEKYACKSEPNINIKLYQGIPKGDKMDQIIQKSVELGVNSIVPVIMDRCISRPIERAIINKVKRWQKISQSAAEQSGRGIVPKIYDSMTLDEAIKDSSNADIATFFYEDGGDTIRNFLNKKESPTDIAIFIGPEGGFSLDEVERLKHNNIFPTTLGERILRTETAPVTALSLLMYLTGNMN